MIENIDVFISFNPLNLSTEHKIKWMMMMIFLNCNQEKKTTKD